MSFFSFVKNSVRKTLWIILAILLVWQGVFGYKYDINIIDGTSMMPSFHHKEIIISEKISDEWAPKRFDAIIIKHEGEKLFKRVIALPGETIEIRKGIFYIDGRKLLDPYSFDPVISEIYSSAPRVLPKQTYFFIGDNRRESLSGYFTLEDVVGKVIF